MENTKITFSNDNSLDSKSPDPNFKALPWNVAAAPVVNTSPTAQHSAQASRLIHKWSMQSHSYMHYSARSSSPCSRGGLHDGLRGAAEKDIDLLAVPGAELPAGRHDDAVAAVTYEHRAL